MPLEALDVRFPTGRRVIRTSDGASGVIDTSHPAMITVAFDDRTRGSFDQAWFARWPGGLRLVSNLVVTAG